MTCFNDLPCEYICCELVLYDKVNLTDFGERIADLFSSETNFFVKHKNINSLGTTIFEINNLLLDLSGYGLGF